LTGVINRSFRAPECDTTVLLIYRLGSLCIISRVWLTLYCLYVIIWLKDVLYTCGSSLCTANAIVHDTEAKPSHACMCMQRDLQIQPHKQGEQEDWRGLGVRIRQRFFQYFSSFAHPMPSAARIDIAIGLQTDATPRQFRDYPCNIMSILGELAKSDIRDWTKAFNVVSLTSIPLCCRPSKDARPSACNWSGIPIDLRVSPGFGSQWRV